MSNTETIITKVTKKNNVSVVLQINSKATYLFLVYGG